MADDLFTRQVALNRQNGLEGGAWPLAMRQVPEAYRAYMGEAAPQDPVRKTAPLDYAERMATMAGQPPDPRAREKARALVAKIMQPAPVQAGGVVQPPEPVRKGAELGGGGQSLASVPLTQGEPQPVAAQILQRAHALVDAGRQPTIDAALKSIFHSDPQAYRDWQASLQVRVDAQSVGHASQQALEAVKREAQTLQFQHPEWTDGQAMEEVLRHNTQVAATYRRARQLPNVSSEHTVTKTHADPEAELTARVELLKAAGTDHVEAWGAVFRSAEGQALLNQYYGRG